MANRSRAWCFTLNNYTPAHENTLKQRAECFNSAYRYIIYGREVAASGTPHLQGYVEFTSGRTLDSAKTILGAPTAHLEPRRGSSTQAADYCRKEDPTPYEYGEISAPGKRSDIETIREMVKSGATLEAIAESCTSCQSFVVAEKLLSRFEPPRVEPPRIIWHYGISGAGKTHTAYIGHPDLRVYMHTPADKWFFTYDRHDVIIFDDFRKDDIGFARFLRVLDNKPLQVETKGGSRQFVSKYIYITTPYSIRDTYPIEEEYLQVRRRVHDEIHFTEKYILTEEQRNAVPPRANQAYPPYIQAQLEASDARARRNQEVCPPDDA